MEGALRVQLRMCKCCALSGEEPEPPQQMGLVALLFPWPLLSSPPPRVQGAEVIFIPKAGSGCASGTLGFLWFHPDRTAAHTDLPGAPQFRPLACGGR